MNRPAAWARELATAGRQAAIVVTSELAAADLTALTRAYMPVVVIDPLNLPTARVTSVGTTNFAGGMLATRHLAGRPGPARRYAWRCGAAEPVRVPGF